MRTYIKWLATHSDLPMVLSTLLQVIVSALAAVIIIYQFNQSNALKRFDNYNYFNQIYSDWYKDISNDIKTNVAWNKLTNKDQAWVRRYIDLHAQEFYFYKSKMLPPEIWEIMIHGANGCDSETIVNFKKFPILAIGYIEWKKAGAFKYPKEFISVLDKKLKECNLYPI